MHNRVELLPLLERVLGGINRRKEFHQDFSRMNQERLPAAHRLNGFFQAGNCRFLLRAIDRNKVSQTKCLSDDRIPEERLLQQNSNSPWYRVDHRGSINRAGMVRDEQTSAGWNSLRAYNAHARSDRTHKEHDAANSGPVQRIRILGNDGVDEQWNSGSDDIQR